jgi:hypothetical protein
VLFVDDCVVEGSDLLIWARCYAWFCPFMLVALCCLACLLILVCPGNLNLDTQVSNATSIKWCFVVGCTSYTSNLFFLLVALVYPLVVGSLVIGLCYVVLLDLFCWFACLLLPMVYAMACI